MPAKICDMLEIDAHEHFDFEFSSVGELVERLKKTDYERLKTFFDTLAEKLSQKTDADVYVFDNSGDILGYFLQAENENFKFQIAKFLNRSKDIMAKVGETINE